MAKRETGYSVTVRLFVPVDMTDLDDPVNKAQAVRDAVRNDDLAGLAAAGKIEAVQAKFVNRETKDAPASTEEPEGEGTDETSEAQADETPTTRRARGRAAAE